MSARDNDNGDARRITNGVEEAQNMLAEHNTNRLWAAASNSDPDKSATVRKSKIQLHAAVMLALQRMRPYIKQQLGDEFWRVDLTELEDREVKPWMSELQYGGEAGLFVLDEFHSPVGSETEIMEQRHSGVASETRHNADLADTRFYRVVVQLLSECMVRLGFGPEPDEHTPQTEISEDTIEEFEKWRKQVVNGK